MPAAGAIVFDLLHVLTLSTKEFSRDETIFRLS
jgi:hypothetical protein